jgi:hypothetical protein
MSATDKDTNTSTSSFVSALVLGCVVVGACTAGFLVLRNVKRFKEVYQSRRWLAPERWVCEEERVVRWCGRAGAGAGAEADVDSCSVFIWWLVLRSFLGLL